MIEIIVGSITYTAALLSCYDGDTCKIKFHNTPEIIAEQTLRFEGFDTPEIRGKCWKEKGLARAAQATTYTWMQTRGTLYSEGKRGKYGRLLVSAPELQDLLIQSGQARSYAGGKRQSWCK